MRRYYEVLPASKSYHGQGPLTYHAFEIEALGRGDIVMVPLKNELVPAIISKEVNKPGFVTKQLSWTKWPRFSSQSLGLMRWLSEYYPAPLGIIVHQFLPQRLLVPGKLSPIASPVNKPITTSLPKLNKEQLQAVRSISMPGTYILHGRTGSGKTRVYQELALATVNSGRSVIVMTPEISLTSQLAKNFRLVFEDRVIIWHSHLTLKERNEIWLKILATERPLVIIGARSAIFTPLKNIGLIVVDESHETAYKQEQAPYYHTVRIAGQLAKLHGARLILGSATPSVVDYYIASQRNSPIIRLDRLAVPGRHSEVNIEIVDLKNRVSFSRQPHLSNPLLKAIAAALDNQEQTLILLNRRGTARTVLCSVCGWQALCPRCDTSLTYHGDEHLMRCHICGLRQPAPSDCPVCHSTEILFKSVGTKALLEVLRASFPQARLQRFDSDNKKSERFEQNYETILKGSLDILVGTQTLAKGLDLPRLSVVGVINADTGLSIPDYTAQERTYQLISQVLGRVGRGHVKGTAIIQTYMPDSPLLKAAIRQDWPTFLEGELKERKQFGFPPFCYLLKLTCRRASRTASQKAAMRLADALTKRWPKTSLSGPTPAFHERHGHSFEWQIIVKAKQRQDLVQIINSLPAGWSYDIDPTSLL